MLVESIKMSWENIINNKLRSFLTMLGIVIGVASIIALITIVQGATNSINDQVTALGVNKIIISASGTPLKRGLSDEDMQAIAALDNISGISPTVTGSTNVIYNGSVKEDVSIQGKNEVYFQSDETLLKSGRAINAIDLQSKNLVTVIGSDVAEDLFYGEDPLGKQVIIKGMTYTVVGTLVPSSGYGSGSLNDTVIIPYTTAMKTSGLKNIVNMDVYLIDTNLADDTVINIKATLNAAFNYKDDAYTVFNMGDMISTFQTMMQMMSYLLAGIAAISLVVGGIGIMNMMLVSITERTMEIGLRKALGATPARIQQQFIIESIFLSIIGGIIGLAFGCLIAYVASILIDIDFAMSVSTILLAVGFSAAVGIIFGYMPARKASRLNPIDALRSL